MTTNEEQIHAAIAEQAGEWFIANQAGALGAAENAAFLAWLKASPVHVREYLGVARVAQQLPGVIGEPQVSLEAFLTQLRAGDENVVSLGRPARGRRAFAPRFVPPQALPVAAALFALAVGAFWWRYHVESFGSSQAYETGHGEQSIARLPDGSVLNLDTDSAVTVRYTRRERVVEVKRGQALFQVAHESRQFRVMAGDAGMVDVGTRFNVRRQPEATVVTVAEGEVAVFRGAPAWLGNASAVPSQVERVRAGYQVRFNSGGLSEQPVPADLHEALAWLEHRIVFEHRPLGEVAAEFNRYASIPVVIEDAELRTLPVSGRFDAADTESFVAFLQTLPGVRVERTSSRIRVLRVTPAG